MGRHRGAGSDPARYGRRAFVLAAAVTLCVTPLVAQQGDPGGEATGVERPRDLRVVPVTERVRIDAVLDDAAWATADSLEIAFEVAPGNNAPARVRTVCRIAYSTDDLYFACRAHDPDPPAIRGFYGRRDAAEGHDRVTLVLDPFDDGRRGFAFTVTALGVQHDAMHDVEGGPDPTWNAIWESAGRITPDGFVVEARIPLSSLRFPRADGTPWGAYFERWWPRSEDVRMLSMRWDPSARCVLCTAHHLVGLVDAAPGSDIEIGPTVTALRSDGPATDPGSGLAPGPVTSEVGVDARWGPTPNVSVDLTANPDFSQVESDALQLDVNNRFALFFRERRPFFLEGADLFATPLRTVFTRSIADPVTSAKLTGKVGPHAGGLLVARDARNQLLVPGAERSTPLELGGGVTSLLGRYRRDVGGSSTVGLLYTGREGVGYHNRVVSADGSLNPVDALTVGVQAARSWSSLAAAGGTDLVDDSAPAGTAAQLDASVRTRSWEAVGQARRLDRGFRSDVGFLTQVDLRGFQIRGNHTFWAPRPDAWYTFFQTGGGLFRDEDLSGRLLNEVRFLFAQYSGPLQSDVDVFFRARRTRFAGRIFNRDDVWSRLAIRPSGDIGLALTSIVGNEIDALAARAVANVQLAPELDLRLGRHVSALLSLQYQRLTIPDGTPLEARFWSVRASVHPTNRHALRLVAQLRDTERDPTLYEVEVSRRRTTLFTQLLYTYQLDARSVLFLGYTDDRVGQTNADLSRRPFVQLGRSFFVKAAYTWRR